LCGMSIGRFVREGGCKIGEVWSRSYENTAD
jgi:hypothetical protein